ncbi:MAG: type 4a pilus biogenesis protein PilO [Candidatus Omnitrophota bacterium]
MISCHQIDKNKNKNKIINIGVIILVIIIVFQLFRSTNSQIISLVQQQNNELEKNKALEEIAVLEKKAELYKRMFVKKDLASIMDTISSIAKHSLVKIISVKPHAEEARGGYLNFSFLITLNAPSYHALGDFISKIENHKDIYLVSEIGVNSTLSGLVGADAPMVLVVSLKINTIAYLQS